MSVAALPTQKKECFFQLSRSFYEYSFASVLSILISLLILQINSIDMLYYPFDYYGDAVFYAMTIKSTITSGWYLENPDIGAPYAHMLSDFPTPEGLNYLIIKGLTLFSSKWAYVLNVFFLLGFPLITISSLFVLQRIGLRYPFALTASILFSFLPHRLIKAQSHLFLSGYYILPLVIWVALLLYQNKLWEEPQRKKRSYLFYCLIAILIGSNGIYYAYFGGLFICVAALLGYYQSKQWKLLRFAGLFIFLIMGSIVINIWPTFSNHIKHGLNRGVYARDPIETEINGLKMTQLVLPRDDDRLFATLKKNYNEHAVCIGENSASSLGLIGALGFLFLLSQIFFKKTDSTIEALSHLNLFALLLSMIGGISSLFSFFFLPQIRCYNRISVFIAFFSLAAFFLLFQKIRKLIRYEWAFCFVILGIGLYTQSSPMDAPLNKYPEIRKEYKKDRAFVRKIEKMMPQNSKIFQLPYMPFPEGPRDRINSYAHFKPALHSRSLKWSFGAMKGRKGDRWQKKVANLNVQDMIQELMKKGFTGLYIDKFGYEDEAYGLVNQLKQMVNAPPLVDYHGRSFWDLRENIKSVNNQRNHVQMSY